jgi:hypothetical protein
MLTENDDDNFLINTSNGIPSTIDDPITIMDSKTLNALALAVWMGKAETFKVVKDLMGGKLCFMDDLFSKQGTSAFEVILSKGHIDLLRYYLPLFLMSCEKKLDQIEVLQKPLLHVAVKNRHFEVVFYLFSYFSQVCPPPAFDVHFVDTETGENAALIACKNLDYRIALFLFEVCSADFGLINNFNENALFLAAKNSSKMLNAFEFIQFLLEKVEIDVSFRFDVVLDMICDEKIYEMLICKKIRQEELVSQEISQITHISIVAKNQFDGDLNDTELLLKGYFN